MRNQRQVKRTKLSAKATLTEIYCNKVHRTVVVDITTEGMAIVVNKIPRNFDRDIYVDLVDPKTGTVIQARGEIVKAEAIYGSTRLNIRFSSISDFAKRRVGQLVDSLKRAELKKQVFVPIHAG